MSAEQKKDLNLNDISDYLYLPQLTENLTAELLQRFATGGDLKPERGLKVYRRALVFSLIDVLADIYPVLKEVLTDEVFRYCARNYIYKNPSRAYDLNKYGKTFPDYVQQQEELKAHPYLYDLGRFEYALHQCYYAASDIPLSLESFKNRVKKDDGAFHLKLRSSAEIIKTEFSVHHIWEVYQDGAEEEKGEALKGNYHFIILQDDYTAVYYPVEKEFLEIIQGIQNGLSWQDLVQLPSVQNAPGLLNRALAHMITENWLAVIPSY